MHYQFGKKKKGRSDGSSLQFYLKPQLLHKDRHIHRFLDHPVKVFVFGGFGSWMGFIQGGPPPVTKKVVLPENWDEVAARYKNLVPNYLQY